MSGGKVAAVLSLAVAGLAQWWIARTLGVGRVARVWTSLVAVAGGCGAVLFLWPEVLIPSWPWPLLPLGARTYAAFVLGHALWAWRLARGPAELSGPSWYLALFPVTAFLAPLLQSAAFRASTPGGILFLLLTAGLAGLAACALRVEKRCFTQGE